MINTIHFMNIRNFDLNLLIVFKTLFDERNVTRASKKIGITQPAMSNALNRLRYLVKDELFIRGPKGMRPTPRAVELSIPVKGALATLNLLYLQSILIQKQLKNSIGFLFLMMLLL